MTANDYVVIDVETSGTNPATDRILSIAALTLAPDGTVERTLHTLLNPGVDPGRTDIHGLTPAILAGAPRYPEVAAAFATQLRGRTLVAHNAAFDYAFLAAEAHRSHTELPVDSVLCTVEFTRLLGLGVDSFRLAALARHFHIHQAHPHDALDDARVLAGILHPVLARAEQLRIPIPVRAPHTLQPLTFATPARHAA